MIAKNAGKSLAKAATIATRYSILRRQGFRDGGKGPGEHQVRDTVAPSVLVLNRRGSVEWCCFLGETGGFGWMREGVISALDAF